MKKGDIALFALALAFGGCNADAERPGAAGLGDSLGGTDGGESDAASDSDDDDDDSDSNGDGESGQTEEPDAGETDGEGEEESGGGEACDQEEFSFVFDPEPPNVMLVLDKSRSMSALWDHDQSPITPDISRWNSLHNVVTGLLADFADEINFGAQLFPAANAFLDEPVNDWSCRVENAPEVAVAAGTSAAILAAMPAGDDLSISGGTPAVAGLESALDHLEQVDGGGARALVFVTDGAANCDPGEAPDDTLFVYDDAVPSVIQDAFDNMSIPVYVVGINILDEMGTKPAVNPFEAITDAATVGGAPAPGADPFYNAFNELQLSEALEDVLTDIECTVNLENEPAFPENVGVTVDLLGYPNVANCDTEDGWVYTAPAGPFNAIQLCGAACDSLQDGGLVEVEYLCPG